VVALDAQFVVHGAPSWVLGYRSCLVAGVGLDAFGAEQKDVTSGDWAEMSSVVAAAAELGVEGVARMEMEQLVEEA